jgi:hypothetical protein
MMNQRNRHPEEPRSGVSKDGYDPVAHPSRLAEDGEHLRMTERSVSVRTTF